MVLIEPMIPNPDRMGRPRLFEHRQVFGTIQYMLASRCLLLPVSFRSVAWESGAVPSARTGLSLPSVLDTNSIEFVPNETRSMGSAVGANITDRQRTFFSENGFLTVENLVAQSEIETYREIVNGLVEGRIASSDSRSDLGGHRSRVRPSVENIIHIMLPSEAVPWLATSPLFLRSRNIARALLGGDLERDMDMLIDKAPHTDTSTPWHQDQAYWMPGMPDRHSVSCWLALDETTLDNGCMWFVPGSHRQPVRTHRHPGETGYALETDASEFEAVAYPLAPGSATFHDGGTLHYSRGNSTSSRRRALVTKFPPCSDDHMGTRTRLRSSQRTRPTRRRIRTRPCSPEMSEPMWTSFRA